VPESTGGGRELYSGKTLGKGEALKNLLKHLRIKSLRPLLTEKGVETIGTIVLGIASFN